MQGGLLNFQLVRLNLLISCLFFWKFCGFRGSWFFNSSKSRTLNEALSEGYSSCRGCTVHSRRLVRFKSLLLQNNIAFSPFDHSMWFLNLLMTSMRILKWQLHHFCFVINWNLFLAAVVYTVCTFVCPFWRFYTIFIYLSKEINWNLFFYLTCYVFYDCFAPYSSVNEKSNIGHYKPLTYTKNILHYICNVDS